MVCSVDLGYDTADLAVVICFCCKSFLSAYLERRVMYPSRGFADEYIQGCVAPLENVDVGVVNDME